MDMKILLGLDRIKTHCIKVQDCQKSKQKTHVFKFPPRILETRLARKNNDEEPGDSRLMGCTVRGPRTPNLFTNAVGRESVQ